MSVYSNKDIEKTVNEKNIAIHPLNKDSITPLGYDISIGEIITLSSDSGNKLVKANGKIEIPPKSLNVVVAKEFIWLSKNVVGTLHSRGTLAAKGIFTNSTNVDPNFSGQMVMSLCNLSSKPVYLEEESHFITLIFHSALTPTLDSPGAKKTARVLAELLKEYSDPIDIAEINKLNAYMNAKNTQYESKFQALIFKCKKWTLIKAIKNYVYDLKSNYGSGFSKSIFSIIHAISFLFLLANLAQLGYYTYTGDVTKASAEKNNFYVILAAVIAITTKK